MSALFQQGAPLFFSSLVIACVLAIIVGAVCDKIAQNRKDRPPKEPKEKTVTTTTADLDEGDTEDSFGDVALAEPDQAAEVEVEDGEIEAENKPADEAGFEPLEAEELNVDAFEAADLEEEASEDELEIGDLGDTDLGDAEEGLTDLGESFEEVDFDFDDDKK